MVSSTTTATTPRGAGTPAGRPPRAPLWRRVLDSDRSWPVYAFIVFAVTWQVYGTVAGGLLVPTFTETVVATGQLLTELEFWDAFYVSNQALVLGFLIAVGLGVPIGILIGRFRTLERITDVYLNILLTTPMAAIIPLLIMSVGFGLASRVILVTIFAIVMVIVSVRAGVRQVDPSLIQMARSFGAGERQIWLRVLIPSSLPAIMTGVRLGLGRAITGMVIVELLMASVALGGLILNARGTFNGPVLYAVIVAILAEALILIRLAQWVEYKVAPWAPSSRNRRRP